MCTTREDLEAWLELGAWVAEIDERKLEGEERVRSCWWGTVIGESFARSDTFSKGAEASLINGRLSNGRSWLDELERDP